MTIALALAATRAQPGGGTSADVRRQRQQQQIEQEVVLDVQSDGMIEAEVVPAHRRISSEHTGITTHSVPPKMPPSPNLGAQLAVDASGTEELGED